MNENKRVGIIFAIIILLMIAGLFLSKNIGKIPENDSRAVGNTAGNLYNGGSVCEYNGKIYFANPYDYDYLYVMDSNGTNVKKLIENNASYINAAGDYVYFYQGGENNSGKNGLGYVIKQTGIFRVKNNGKKLSGLYSGNLSSLSLIGNNLYYQSLAKDKYLKFCKTSIFKSGSEIVSNDYIDASGVYGGRIYFNGKSGDQYLYAFDPEDSSVSTVLNYDLWQPIVEGNKIYFMDIHNDYKLCVYDMSSGTAQTLVNERIDSFNLLGSVIFYQTNGTNAALKRIRTDGTENAIVASGVYAGIQMTEKYTFFTEYGKSVPLYVTPTQSFGNVSEFTAAQLLP